MDIRANHKTRLKAILETILYNGVNLPVFVKVTTQNDRYPYAFITSAKLTPNKDEGTLSDRGTYYRVREYFLNVVYMNDGTLDSINGAEIQIDQTEQLIIDKIGDESTRNDAQFWSDIYCDDVSSPFQGSELSIEGNTVVKTFTIQIETEEIYD